MKFTSPGLRAPHSHRPEPTPGRFKLQLLKFAGSNLVNSSNGWVSLSWCIHKHSSTGSRTTQSNILLCPGSARTNADTSLKLIGPDSGQYYILWNNQLLNRHYKSLSITFLYSCSQTLRKAATYERWCKHCHLVYSRLQNRDKANYNDIYNKLCDGGTLPLRKYIHKCKIFADIT